MGRSEIRRPVVAGQFYPATAQELKQEIDGFIDKKAAREDVVACVLPHAGYMYSGMVAGQTLSRLNVKDEVILLGPNHTGRGEPFSIMTRGAWETPLGDVAVAEELAGRIAGNSQYLTTDTAAHVFEHSLEVELPLLQYLHPRFSIVPVTVQQGALKVLREIGKAIATAIKEARKEASVLIIASSDMTHYEPQAEAEKKDKEAIAAILTLDEERLINTVEKRAITMCGYIPVAIMLSAAKLLGATKGKLVTYQTSGDVTGDHTSVVGYAGILIL